MPIRHWQVCKTPEHSAWTIRASTVPIGAFRPLRWLPAGIDDSRQPYVCFYKPDSQITQFDSLDEPGDRIPRAQQLIIDERLKELQHELAYDEHGADDDADGFSDMEVSDSKDAAAPESNSSSSAVRGQRGTKRARKDSILTDDQSTRPKKKTAHSTAR